MEDDKTEYNICDGNKGMVEILVGGVYMIASKGHINCIKFFCYLNVFFIGSGISPSILHIPPPSSLFFICYYDSIVHQ